MKWFYIIEKDVQILDANVGLSLATLAMLVALLPSVPAAAHVQHTEAFLCGPDVLIFLPDVLLQEAAAVCV